MTGALTWLNEAMVWLASWIPRLVIVLATERGIRYRHGADVSVLEPGLHVYWPIVTRVQVVNVMRQVLNLSMQTLTTADERTIIASGVLVYRIVDVEKYLVANHDADAGIDEVTCAAIRQVLLAMDMDTIQAASVGGVMDDKLRRQSRKVLAPFGVRVESCRLTDCAQARVLSLAGIPYDLHLTQYGGKADAA